ncbi:MAG: hypothetical protein DHS80DRAFT_33432 [Piptocephalis tieghemiana]|nr:MAG: hypothetical protein DHS80DRAFT_33432 [Piptocephalis tieghemiana]
MRASYLSLWILLGMVFISPGKARFFSCTRGGASRILVDHPKHCVHLGMRPSSTVNMDSISIFRGFQCPEGYSSRPLLLP